MIFGFSFENSKFLRFGIKILRFGFDFQENGGTIGDIVVAKVSGKQNKKKALQMQSKFMASANVYRKSATSRCKGLLALRAEVCVVEHHPVATMRRGFF